MIPNMTNYTVAVDNEEFDIEEQEIDNLDLLPTGNNYFHLLKDNQAYNIQVLHSNHMEKTASVSVNGNTYKVKISDAYDQMVKEMGLLINSLQKVNEIKAPMPGLILDIMVDVGQEIIEGTPLLVLSAMKMENIILSQGEGIIKSIEVKKDDAVEKGQLIIEME